MKDKIASLKLRLLQVVGMVFVLFSPTTLLSSLHTTRVGRVIRFLMFGF